MTDLLSLAAGNLLSPMILAFALGALAAFLRSDLEIPEGAAKALAIYLMFAIGFKGGVAMHSASGLALLWAIVAALVLSTILPLLAFGLLRGVWRQDRTNAAAIAAHYGSISIVTFVTAAEFLRSRDIPYEGYLVAMTAVMETPAILIGLLLAGRQVQAGMQQGSSERGELVREVLVNGSVMLLVGGFVIGWITGDAGLTKIKPFVVDLFNGALCIFLLDMGLVAVRQGRAAKHFPKPLILFGLVMPPLGAALGLATAWALGLSTGGAMLLAVLSASASYIAVPAAMRLALPAANPSLSVTLALAITFPFNVAIGLPLYLLAAQYLFGG
ncbi:MAG: sodium-dependent bicarbonate transport family permease [Ferrovibrio sp.]|uniref:sodium-dependent bicarbonate transport family permease n=1 Tax=Ferrovibrio sp. TaxID=1917215 RepID=UPI00391B58A8